MKLSIIICCVGCASSTKESATPDQLELRPHDSLFTTQVIPRLKLKQDTLNIGDSLIATIGVIFKPNLREEQKKEIINSLSYYVDLSGTRADPSDSLFSKNHRINDSSFRVSLLPDVLNYKEGQVVKKEFLAHVKMNYLVVEKNDPKTYLFSDKFVYYLKHN